MSDFLNILREREVPDWLRAGYALTFLVTFAHALVTKKALTCCPPGYADADIFTFVQCGQAAGIWTFTIIAIVEVTSIMVFMVPTVYYGIKGKGEREGIVKGMEKGREEGMEKGIEKGRAEGRAEGKAEVDATLAAVRDAMRDAGVDDETRRRVEDDVARRRRNGS